MNETNRQKNPLPLNMKKKELIFFAVLLIAALAAWFIMYQMKNSKDYGSITISVSGQSYGTYPLNKDQEIRINETNICTIHNGRATMTEATCPDKLCMYQMPIGEQGGMIVCLPNEVFIEGIPSKDAQSSGNAIDALG